MSIKGFDPKWKDIPDYIIGITKEIWEDRGISTLHQYYAPTIPVRMPGSLTIGNVNTIASTMANLAELPDRQLLAEDVIWCGDPDNGFLSSHRGVSLARHVHDGVYGKATGKTLTYRAIADCAVRNNQIYDEWLIRDQGAIVRQLGLDPKAYAGDLIEREGGPDKCVKPFHPRDDIDGGYNSRGNDHPVGQRYAGIIERIMGADMAAIPREYDRGVHLCLPGGVTAHGWSAADQFWMRLRAAFPNAAFATHHTIGREDPMMPPRAALRWSLTGKHENWGAFGAPSGAEVHVMGISHAEFGPLGLRREYILYDEAAIWKQILLKTG